MKLYRQNGTYYEKQADVPKGKFETVEFPFAASPKADFVAWMNAQEKPANIRVAEAASGMTAEQAMQPSDLLQDLSWKPAEAKPVGPCRSTEPSEAKDDLAFRREVSERWDSQPLSWRLDLGMLAFEDARNVVRS